MSFVEVNLFVKSYENSCNIQENLTCILLRSSKTEDISFQERARNKLMNYIWTNIDWIGVDKEFFQHLISTNILPVLSAKQDQNMQKISHKENTKKSIKFPSNYKRNDY
jgi:hypothetical protein